MNEEGQDSKIISGVPKKHYLSQTPFFVLNWNKLHNNGWGGGTIR